MKAVVTPAGIDLKLTPAEQDVSPKKELLFTPPEDRRTQKLRWLEETLKACVQNEELREQFMRTAKDSFLRTKSFSQLQTTVESVDILTRRRNSAPILRPELWSELHSTLSKDQDDKESKHMLLPHKDVVPKQNLPFRQRPIIYSKTATCWGRLVSCTESMVFPAWAAAFSLCTTTDVMMWNMLALVSQLKDRGEIWVSLFTAQCAFLYLISFALLRRLLATPLRALLFYRLWEHKLVINFKQRTPFTHTPTLLTIVVLVVGFVASITLGLLVHAEQAYFIVCIQGYSALVWVFYSNLNMDRHLFYMTASVRQQEGALDTTQNDIDTVKDSLRQKQKSRVSNSTMSKIGSGCSDLQVVAEADVKYDILTLRWFYEQQRRFAGPPTKEGLTKARWTKVLLTYVGRLGNTKASTRAFPWFGSLDPTRCDLIYAYMRFFRRLYDYGSEFFGLYDDDEWHRWGSFANEPNSVQASDGVIVITTSWLYIHYLQPAIYAYILYEYKAANDR